MKWTEIAPVVAAVAAVVGGAFWIGTLSDTVNKIRENNPQQKAEELIAKASEIQGQLERQRKIVAESYTNIQRDKAIVDEQIKAASERYEKQLKSEQLSETSLDAANRIMSRVDEKLLEMASLNKKVPRLRIDFDAIVLDLTAQKTTKSLWSGPNSLCFLTRIGGSLAGAGEWVRVYEINDSWFAEGQNINNTIQVEVTCAKFQLNPAE